MTTDNDPNIILTLVAHGHRATDVWADPHNNPFYIPPFSQAVNGEPLDAVVSQNDPFRQVTPSPDDPGRQKTTEAKLHITFGNKPKNPQVGYVLGSDRETCDIFLGSLEDCISHQMYTISFNQHNEVIMTSASGNPTVVKYHKQKADRTKFTWIFLPDQEKIFVNAGDTKGDAIKFFVVAPKHETDRAAYEAKCREFMGLAVRAAYPSATTESPFYLQMEELGKGTFGSVHKARVMPDGRTCAVKYFKSKTVWTSEVDILRKLSKEPHEHIVEFIDCGLGKDPYLVMGLAPKKNLKEQYNWKAFNIREIGLLLHQMLHALVFLHDKFGIIHRDVKPENILCDSRTHFRLADFGLAKESHVLRTFKGTKHYMAPEMFANEPYTAAVDVWALGIVIAKLLTRNRPPGYKGDEGTSWCTAMIVHFKKYAERWLDSEQGHLLIMMVQRYMLRMKPQDRESASDCLDRGDYLWWMLDQNSREGSQMSITPPANNTNGSSIYIDSEPMDNAGGSEENVESEESGASNEMNGSRGPPANNANGSSMYIDSEPMNNAGGSEVNGSGRGENRASGDDESEAESDSPGKTMDTDDWEYLERKYPPKR